MMLVITKTTHVQIGYTQYNAITLDADSSPDNIKQNPYIPIKRMNKPKKPTLTDVLVDIRKNPFCFLK